jgi:hypothetical protein
MASILHTKMMALLSLSHIHHCAFSLCKADLQCGNTDCCVCIRGCMQWNTHTHTHTYTHFYLCTHITQAIAAMLRALAANPSNMDVLMALGVSHTNELDTG